MLINKQEAFFTLCLMQILDKTCSMVAPMPSVEERRSLQWALLHLPSRKIIFGWDQTLVIRAALNFRIIWHLQSRSVCDDFPTVYEELAIDSDEIKSAVSRFEAGEWAI